MIYVVLIPAFIWTLLLTSGWMMLAYLAYKLFAFRHLAMSGLIVVLGMQAIVASSSAFITSFNPINYFACYMGYYGIWFSTIVTLLEAVVLIYLYTIWPRTPKGERAQIKTWISIWFTFNLIALLAHMRSAALCTV